MGSPVSSYSVESLSSSFLISGSPKVIGRGARFRLKIFSRKVDLIKALLKGLEDFHVGALRSRGFGNISLKNLRIREIGLDEIDKRAEEVCNSEDLELCLCSPTVVDFNFNDSLVKAYSYIFKPENVPPTPNINFSFRCTQKSVFYRYSSRTNKRLGVEVYNPPSLITLKRPSSFQERRSIVSLEICGLGKLRKMGLGEVKIAPGSKIFFSQE